MQIIHEDNEILVINKPCGLVVNRSQTTKSATLQDWLDENYSFGGEGDFKDRSGIVHRLDKDTSGVLVIAKTQNSYESLVSQFKNRTTQKEYRAVVFGTIQDEIIEINAPLGRNPKNRFKFAIVADGKAAFTRVEKIKETKMGDNLVTFVRVFPKTGRTHQIRVHMSALGNPIIGDPIYCTSKLLETSQSLSDRMLLHAYKIQFNHPKTDERSEFVAELPVEFSA